MLRHSKAGHQPDQLSLGEVAADGPQPVGDLEGQGADARAGEGIVVRKGRWRSGKLEAGEGHCRKPPSPSLASR